MVSLRYVRAYRSSHKMHRWQAVQFLTNRGISAEKMALGNTALNVQVRLCETPSAKCVVETSKAEAASNYSNYHGTL